MKQLCPITKDQIDRIQGRNRTETAMLKSEAIRFYHRWLKAQRSNDRVELDRLLNQINNFKYYKENKDKINEGSRKHYQENKDKCLKYGKEYYQRNKDKILKCQREYQQSAKGKVAWKKYYQENKEKLLKINKEYRKKNKEKINKRKRELRREKKLLQSK